MNMVEVEGMNKTEKRIRDDAAGSAAGTEVQTVDNAEAETMTRTEAQVIRNSEAEIVAGTEVVDTILLHHDRNAAIGHVGSSRDRKNE